MLEEAHDGHADLDSPSLTDVAYFLEDDLKVGRLGEVEEVLRVATPVGVVLALDPPFAPRRLFLPGPVHRELHRFR